jgi:hypothetical protein
MLSVQIKGSDALIKKLQKLPRSVRAVIMTTLNEQMAQLQSYIVSQKLSGQVLAKHTEKLVRSVVPIPATVTGTKVRAGVAAGGGPAFYGKFFEEPSVGGTGGIGHAWAINAVKGRALRFVVGGEVVFRQYVFHPPLAARPFLRPSAEEKLPGIIETMQEAINEALNEP